MILKVFQVLDQDIKTKKGKKDMKELDKLAMKKALGTKKEYNDMFFEYKWFINNSN